MSPRYTSCSFISFTDDTPVSSSISLIIKLRVTLRRDPNVPPLCIHSSTSYFGSSSSYLTNLNSATPEKSVMGNTLLKTACKPMSSRSPGLTSFCKKSS